MSSTVKNILFVIYIIAGWWAINKVWYSKHTYIVTNQGKFFCQKFALALFLGWLAIPVAIVMTILGK